MEDEIIMNDMNEQKFIKDVIYENRKKKQMTQEQLADLLNVSNKTISKWERGIGYPDMTLIPTLAKVLDISISDLFNVKEASPQKLAGEEVYNPEVIIKFQVGMFISLVLLIVSIAFPVCFLLLTHGVVTITVGYILGTIMFLASTICASITSYRFYCFFYTKPYKKNYIIIFIKDSFSYMLTIYVLLTLLVLFIPSDFVSVLTRIILYLTFSLPLLSFCKKLKLKLYKNRINIILAIVSAILAITTIIFMICHNQMWYVLLLIISQTINYTIMFLQTKIIGTEGESN